MQFYSPIIIKFALGIICLIVQINLMGKGNLAPTSAMDQVQNYVLGGIIGGVIYNDSITVLQFVLVLILWTLLVLILKFAKEHNRYVKQIVDGKPITLIKDGQVVVKLRANGIYEVQLVKRAVLEQNGQLTIVEYGDESIRYPIIVDGQANMDVLELIKKDEHWLLTQIQEQGFQRLQEIYLGEYLSGQLSLSPYEEKTIS